jgi:hypothetical protein
MTPATNARMSIDTGKSRRGRPRVDSEDVSARMERGMLDALDAWIAAQPEPRPGRSEAIRRLVADAFDSGRPPTRSSELWKCPRRRPGRESRAGIDRREAGREAPEGREMKSYAWLSRRASGIASLGAISRGRAETGASRLAIRVQSSQLKIESYLGTKNAIAIVPKENRR